MNNEPKHELELSDEVGRPVYDSEDFSGWSSALRTIWRGKLPIGVIYTMEGPSGLARTFTSRGEAATAARLRGAPGSAFDDNHSDLVLVEPEDGEPHATDDLEDRLGLLAIKEVSAPVQIHRALTPKELLELKRVRLTISKAVNAASASKTRPRPRR